WTTKVRLSWTSKRSSIRDPPKEIWRPLRCGRRRPSVASGPDPFASPPRLPSLRRDGQLAPDRGRQGLPGPRWPVPAVQPPDTGHEARASPPSSAEGRPPHEPRPTAVLSHASGDLSDAEVRKMRVEGCGSHG